MKCYGIGKRSLLYNAEGCYGDYCVVCEGENDIFTIMEQGIGNVVATGGMPTSEQLNELRSFKKLYLCFDSDQAGEKFTETVNKALPDIEVYKISIPCGFKDIDDYFVKFPTPIAFSALMESAVRLENDGYYTSVEGGKVSLKNRAWKLTFLVKDFDSGKQRYKGDLSHYLHDKLDDIKSGILIPDSMPKKLLAYYEPLQEAIDNHYNRNFEKKTLKELSSIYDLTNFKNEVIQAAAKQLLELDDENREEMLNSFKAAFKAKVIIEIHSAENEELINEGLDFPSSNPCQVYIMDENPMAYIYFNSNESDGNGAYIEHPCLLSSDRRIIHLDAYSKENASQAVIIDKRFKISNAVKDPIIETSRASLKHGWVQKYLANTIDPAWMKPEYIVREYERLFRGIYYTKNNNFYKTLALFCYSTYYSDLFGTLAYLYLTAEKGSGKSTILFMVSRLAFDPWYISNASTASFFRMCAQGGTIIVDEFESKASRTKNQEDDMVQLMKAGYTKDGGICARVNPDDQQKIDVYDVYCPKVVSCIGELDDVLRDRCLCLTLEKVSANIIPEYILDKEIFNNTYGGEMIKLSSLAALSALESFQEVYTRFNAISALHTDSDRGNQIVKPLYTLAAMIGSDYTSALDNILQANENSKSYVESQTTESLVRTALHILAASWVNGAQHMSSYDKSRIGITHPKVMIYFGKNLEETYELDCEFYERGFIKYDGSFVETNTFVISQIINSLYDSYYVPYKAIHFALNRIMPDNQLMGQKRTSITFGEFKNPEWFQLNNRKATAACYKFKFDVFDFNGSELLELYRQKEDSLNEELEKIKLLDDAELEY